jgi:diaminohydroxyphosphoribosylaminopyrimidine deaminase/5-amino-6-(5-phosphoribosylamino)uracil reductase
VSVTLPVDVSVEQHWLDRAARLALRGHGGVQPNPLVGCIIIDAAGVVVGSGYHRQAGGPHAEVAAIKMTGDRAQGSTLYVTLEPCSHHGRTPPCVDAIITAGINAVVYAESDPNPQASGGADALRAAGVDVRQVSSTLCTALITPFAHRLRTGLPWITAKWAQTLDGYIATRTGHSQWISGERSRHLVHRERGRVDAILTGIGTVTADDPMLTARGVRARRVATRIVVDPWAQLPLGSALVRTAPTTPVIVLCLPTALPDRIAALRQRGVHVHSGSETTDRLNLTDHMKYLSAKHNIATVLVEAGPGLCTSLLKEHLINELAVFVAPLLMADEHATPPLHGIAPAAITDAHSLTLYAHHRRGDDVLMRYVLRGKEAQGNSGS